MRLFSPSTTLTLTRSVSPGWKSGISLPAVSFVTCSFSSSWIRFMGSLRRQRHVCRRAVLRVVRVGRASTIKHRPCHAVVAPYRMGPQKGGWFKGPEAADRPGGAPDDPSESASTIAWVSPDDPGLDPHLGPGLDPGLARAAA